MVRILGIESSCDETAAAVVEDGERVLSSVVASQMSTHGRYGGVVRPWDVPPEERDLLAAKNRLDEWAKATRSSVLLWLGHGKTTGAQARLLIRRSADADELIPPATLTDKLVDLLKRREQNFWVAVVVEACSVCW